MPVWFDLLSKSDACLLSTVSASNPLSCPLFIQPLSIFPVDFDLTIIDGDGYQIWIQLAG